MTPGLLAYEIYDPETRHIVTARDVTFTSAPGNILLEQHEPMLDIIPEVTIAKPFEQVKRTTARKKAAKAKSPNV